MSGQKKARCGSRSNPVLLTSLGTKANVGRPIAVARVFRRGGYRMAQRKTLASEEASYSKEAAATKK